VALVFVARAFASRRPDWLDLIAPLAMVGAALYSQRHIPLAAIALAPMGARAMADWPPTAPRAPSAGDAPFRLRRWHAATRREIGNAEGPMNLVIATVALAIAMAIAPAVSDWQRRRFESMLPVRSADYILANELQGPMLNDYHAGGYLIHRLHPQVPVFIDGRYNPYVGAVMQDYERLMRLEAGWEEIITRYDIRLAVLARPRDGLGGAMVASGRYRLVQADSAYGVLIRNDGSRADLLDVAPSPAGR